MRVMVVKFVWRWEGYNGWARPLDQQVLAHGWRLFNVNNLKLARFKEIFPAPAKTDALDARRILELFSFEQHLIRGQYLTLYFVSNFTNMCNGCRRYVPDC